MSLTINQTHLPSRQIYLNSKHATLIADTRKKSHCWFQFDEPVRVPKSYDILISLTDAVIPVSWYVVDDSTRNLTVAFTNFGDYTFTLPKGNIDAISIATFLSPTTPITVGPASVSFACAYQPQTNTYNFIASEPFTITSKNPIFGLSGAVRSSVLVAGFHITSSDISIDLAGTRAIFIKSNFITNSVDSKQGSTNAGVLGKINIDVGFNELQHYRNDVSYKTKILEKDIRVVEISIWDEDHEFVDFNGVDWSLTITIDILGKSPEAFMPDAPEPQLFSGANM